MKENKKNETERWSDTCLLPFSAEIGSQRIKIRSGMEDGKFKNCGGSKFYQTLVLAQDSRNTTPNTTPFFFGTIRRHRLPCQTTQRRNYHRRKNSRKWKLILNENWRSPFWEIKLLSYYWLAPGEDKQKFSLLNRNWVQKFSQFSNFHDCTRLNRKKSRKLFPCYENLIAQETKLWINNENSLPIFFLVFSGDINSFRWKNKTTLKAGKIKSSKRGKFQHFFNPAFFPSLPHSKNFFFVQLLK